MEIQQSLNDISSRLEKIESISNKLENFIVPQSYTIFIQNLQHPFYRLRCPIPILIEHDDDIVIATYHDIDMYGTGADIQEALSDLCDAIVEYYETLKDNEGNLGLLTSQHYAFLKQIIEENQD
ncbi:hypothetical protein FJZ31_12030 [Candidatus Poribacteria bacterium]|nr:hypothetical protein [Candidatus Poribacteria bacterium]